MSVLDIVLAAGGGGFEPNPWNLTYATYSSNGNNWDITKAVWSGKSLAVSAQDTAPSSAAFSSDGLNLYVIGRGTDTVYQYSLSQAWVPQTGTYTTNSFSVAAQEANPSGIYFKPDGTKMYIIGYSSDAVHQYTLATAWDISTASYDSVSFSVATEETNPHGLFFKPDGTKMYVVGTTGDDINEYDLSTSWDISTAIYLQNFSIVVHVPSVQDLYFTEDGTKVFFTQSTSELVRYDLSTPWDVSTCSYAQTISTVAGTTSATGAVFDPYGNFFYMVGTTNSSGVASAQLYGFNIAMYSVVAQVDAGSGIRLSTNGREMYITNTTTASVFQYNLAVAWNPLTATYLQSFSVSAEETSPTGVFFKPDGTKMYVVGNTGDDVNEYDLSTPWDISTAVYLQNFSVAAQETGPSGLFFKPDGTKMYVIGTTGDDVNEYDLSTPWDISTAVYLQNFSVIAQGTNPAGVNFKYDGTLMYTVSATTDAISEYSLSTPWDISTAVYSKDTSTMGAIPTGFCFSTTGQEIFIIDSFLDAVITLKITSIPQLYA